MSFIGMYTLVVNPIDLSHINANLYSSVTTSNFSVKFKDILSLKKVQVI